MAHKIEPAPTGRASCRGCKKGIAKGDLRFCEEFQNPYGDEGGLSFRYWHLSCASEKMANELRGALTAYDGEVPDRAGLEASIAGHAKPELPHAERAPNGRARCRFCDATIQKGELRVAFERVFDGPMGPQKGAGYVHPACLPRYVDREREGGHEAFDLADAMVRVEANSKLDAADLEAVRTAVAAPK
jgi:hypothetical protein